MKVLLSISALIIAISIGYYLLWYIPQQKAEQQHLLNLCLQGVEINYNKDWATNCKSRAKQVTEGYKNCIATAPNILDSTTAKKQCASIWGKPDNSAKCSLPASLADSINKNMQNNKTDCFSQYP